MKVSLREIIISIIILITHLKRIFNVLSVFLGVNNSVRVIFQYKILIRRSQRYQGGVLSPIYVRGLYVYATNQLQRIPIEER